MLHRISHSFWGKLLALTLALVLPGCAMLQNLLGRGSQVSSLTAQANTKLSAAGLPPTALQAVNNTTAVVKSGNVSALAGTAISLGVPGAMVLGKMAVKAIQTSIARRAEERQRQLEARQLFYAGQCKLDVQPAAATSGKDAAGLESQAEQAFSKGDYTATETSLKAAIEKRQAEKGGEAALGRNLNRLAALYLATSQLDKVEAPASRSLEVREKLGKDSADVAETLGTLGAYYQQKSDFGKAETALQRALKIREKELKEDHICVAQTVNQMAGLYKDMALYSKAEPLYERALNIRQSKLGADSLEVAQSQSDLGGLYVAMGNYSSAEPFYQKALEVRQAKLGADHPDVAETLNDMGSLERRRGSYTAAEALYRKALAIREAKLPASDPRIAESLTELAALYETMGDAKAAQPLLERALKLRRDALGQDSVEVAETLTQMAIAEQLSPKGDPARAEDELRLAIGIRERKLGVNHPTVADSQIALGDLLFTQKKADVAVTFYNKALAIREKALGKDHPLYAEALQRLGRLERARGNLKAAGDYFTQALAIRQAALGQQHPLYAETEVSLASVQIGQGQIADALPKLGHALEVNDSLLKSLSGAADETRVDAVLRSARDLEDITYSLVAQKSPSDDVVKLVVRTALLRKGRSIDEAADTSRALYQGLSKEEQDKLGRLREVRTQRADLALSGSGVYPPDAYQKILKDLQESEDKQLKELMSSSPQLSHRLPDADGDLMTQVQSKLPNDAALFEVLAYHEFNFQPKAGSLEVGQGPVRYAALVILPEGKPQAFDLGPGAAVNSAVAELLITLTDAESDWQPVAKKVSELVIKPAAGALAGRGRIYIAPDGQLSLVPFAVLSDDKGLLIDHFELSYLTSGRDFTRRPAPPAKEPSSKPVTLIADPQFAVNSKDAGDSKEAVRGVFRGVGLSRVPQLPGTREEVKSIEKTLKKVKPTVYYGADATKRLFLNLAQPPILHVATHGLFLTESSRGGDNSRGIVLEDEDGSKAPQPAQQARPASATATPESSPRTAFGDKPLLSSMLVLAGAETASHTAPEKRDPSLGNGLVTALEVAGMNLWGTQLVVLSACETGRGDVSALGQGVYGLRRAVMVAGAETLLTSLWKVDDKATRDLMTQYYKSLMKGKGRGESMREAALALRKKRPHPYFWAPFIAIGRSGPLAPITAASAAKGKAAAAEESDDSSE